MSDLPAEFPPPPYSAPIKASTAARRFILIASGLFFAIGTFGSNVGPAWIDERLRDEAKVPIVYVSHDPGEVKRIASRVVRIEGGSVVATGGVELLGA